MNRSVCSENNLTSVHELVVKYSRLVAQIDIIWLNNIIYVSQYNGTFIVFNYVIRLLFT